MAKDEVKTAEPVKTSEPVKAAVPTGPGSTEFTHLALVDTDSYDSLGVVQAVHTGDRGAGARVDVIRKVTGGFEVSYQSKIPKNRLDAASGLKVTTTTRFVPFSFVKSAVAGD